MTTKEQKEAKVEFRCTSMTALFAAIVGFGTIMITTGSYKRDVEKTGEQSEKNRTQFESNSIKISQLESRLENYESLLKEVRDDIKILINNGATK